VITVFSFFATFLLPHLKVQEYHTIYADHTVIKDCYHVKLKIPQAKT